MISIYTHSTNPLTKEFWKSKFKKLAGKYSGPDAVLDSLLRGLRSEDIPFELNAPVPKYHIVHVISGRKALAERIVCKTEEQTLLAGPAIFTTPLEEGEMLSSPAIDSVLAPAQWVKNFYISLVPTLASKISIWPAGVRIPEKSTDKKGKVIVFKKHISEKVFRDVLQKLDEKKICYDVLQYGNFSHAEYLQKLTSAPYMIYLQKTESQGLALQEAWAHDVPTLVYQHENWSWQAYSWSDPKISAPYLSPESGLFFTLETLDSALQNIARGDFQPKTYCEQELSDQASIKILFDIINSHHETSH